MNYFEHHIGDYDKNTAHLSACEDGIYHRMLRRYYDKERPLPADVNEIKRLVRARVPAEKKAVDDVLGEFFHLEPDGWHHDVCDAAIADYLAGEPEREVKKANEDNRLRRHREERARLFKVITDAGEHAPWNTPMAELRQLVERLEKGPPATPAPRPPETPPATAPATPATATQTPIPIHHPPTTSSSSIPLHLTVESPPPPDGDREPGIDLLGHDLNGHAPKTVPDCPHAEVLALWAEVMPELPQHDPSMWADSVRADHLRARWRATAALKGWASKDEGLAYFRRLFRWCRKSKFLMGEAQSQGRRPFEFELAWLVNATNWIKVHEGKFHG